MLRSGLPHNLCMVMIWWEPGCCRQARGPSWPSATQPNWSWSHGTQRRANSSFKDTERPGTVPYQGRALESFTSCAETCGSKLEARRATHGARHYSRVYSWPQSNLKLRCCALPSFRRNHLHQAVLPACSTKNWLAAHAGACHNWTAGRRCTAASLKWPKPDGQQLDSSRTPAWESYESAPRQCQTVRPSPSAAHCA